MAFSQTTLLERNGQLSTGNRFGNVRNLNDPLMKKSKQTQSSHNLISIQEDFKRNSQDLEEHLNKSVKKKILI